jgi:hypothetical protein
MDANNDAELNDTIRKEGNRVYSHEKTSVGSGAHRHAETRNNEGTGPLLVRHDNISIRTIFMRGNCRGNV